MKKILLLMLALLIVGGVKATETKVHEHDYTGDTTYPWYRTGAPTESSFDVSDGLLVITNNKEQTNNWDLQPFVDDGISTIYGYTYKVRFTLKCTAEGSLTCNMGTWSAGKSTNFSVTSTEDFVTKEVTLNDFSASATNVHVLLQGGKYIGTIYLKKVEVYLIEPEAPIKTIDLIEDVATSGSTFSTVPFTYKKFSVNGVPDLAFSINPFSMGDYDDFIIDIAEPTTVGDWLIANVAKPYAHNGWWETISEGTSGQVKLGDGHKTTTSLVLQAGNPNEARDIIIKDVYFYKYNGEKNSILSTLGGEDYVVEAAGATAQGDKAFDITNVNVANYNDLVLTFSSPTEGTWTVTYDGTSENIPTGSTTYTVDVSALNTISSLSLSVGAGDFPRANNFEKLTLEKHSTKTMDALANDEIFSFDQATGYDDKTKKLTQGGWTFTNPVDLSNWKYLVITTSQSANNTSAKIYLTDVNGVSCTDADNTHDNFRGMVLDQHNNKNAVCIDLYYLSETKGLDISKIKSLTFGGYWGGDANLSLSQVYLTNYLATKMIGSGYVPQHDGDVVRNYTETGKYGTICLPYKASVSGALVYSIAGKGNSYITLTREDGLLEAGKPYFYMSYDEVSAGDDNRNVNFFRADWTGNVASPVENNGMIGTFSEITAPAGANYWILSGNNLYDTEGCTDGDAVTIGANKAYIDTNKITSKAAGSRTILLSYDGAEDNDPTAIESTEAVEVLTDGVFYDMSGREVKNPTPGIYIVKYGNVTKKVMIK